MANNKGSKMFKLIWRIEDMNPCYCSEEQQITSPEFIVECLGGSSWQLKFYPKSKSRKGFSTCDLYRIKEGIIGNIKIEYEIALTVAYGENLKYFKILQLFSKEIEGKICHEIPIEKLRDARKNCDDDILTISYTFSTSSPTLSRATGCEVISKMVVNRCSFLWNVEEPDSSKWSQTIKCILPGICPIEITLISLQGYIATKILLLNEKPNWPRLITGKIALLDVEGIERYSKSDKHQLRAKGVNERWSFPFAIEENKLKSEKPVVFLENGVFSLMCYFASSNLNKYKKLHWMQTKKYTYDIPINSSNSKLDNLSTLHLDVSAMLHDRTHSDVNLKTGTEVLPCHKFILAARSPVFYAMFKKKEMTESQTGIVDILDVDASTLKSFLEFLYTDTVSDMGYELSSKLLIAADKYQVVSLQDKCLSFLKSILSVENVCDVLCMADIVGHQLLKKSAINYIKIHSDKILLSSQWCALIKSNCQLISEVLYTFSAELKNATK